MKISVKRTITRIQVIRIAASSSYGLPACMPRTPVSFRLPPDVLDRLECERVAGSHRTLTDALIALVRTSPSTPAWRAQELVASEPFIREDAVLVSAHQLRLWREQGVDLALLRAAIASVLRRHVQHYGWPLAPIPAPIHTVLGSLRNGESRKASAYLKATFASFWCAAGGPAVRALDPGWFEDVLRYRMGHNASGEVFDITWGELRRAVQVQRRTVSFFQPSLAYRVYSRLGREGLCVWDPSGGFGARLLGFAAHASASSSYFANEPARRTREDLENLSRSLPHVDVRISARGSEHGHPDVASSSCHLVFTCPPYFGKEAYFDEPGQAWHQPTQTAWIRNYLRPTLACAREAVRPDGTVIFVVDDVPLFTKAAAQEGLTQVSCTQMPRRRDAFARSKSAQAKSSESLIVWRRA